MEVILIYIIYLWISIIHCVFVGSTMYFLFGKSLNKNNKWTNTFLIAIILAILETYWMIFPEFLGMRMHTDNEAILTHFDISSDTNILKELRPKYFHILLWILEGFYVQKYCSLKYNKIFPTK